MVSLINLHWKLLIFILAIAGLSIFTVGSIITNNNFNDLLLNIVSELIGIIITVVIIDNLNNTRYMKDKLQQLRMQLNSKTEENKSEILTEVQNVKYRNLLVSIDFRYVDLSKSTFTSFNLSRATFISSNLSYSNLNFTNLSRTDFSEACLHRSRLFGAIFTDIHYQLCHCYSLHNTILPNGERYDGRYKLQGDRIAMTIKGVTTDEEKAKFYGVTLEEFSEGQEWADKHLSIIKRESRSDDRKLFKNHMYIPDIELIGLTMDKERKKIIAINGKPVEEYSYLF